MPQRLRDEEQLTHDIIKLVDKYGCHGYRMFIGLQNNTGWHVNHKQVEGIWRRQGLKIPQRQKKKERLRPKRSNNILSYDVMQNRTDESRACRTLNIIDKFTREALMSCVDRKLNSTDVLDALTDLFILRISQVYIRSHNGREFIAQMVRD